MEPRTHVVTPKQPYPTDEQIIAAREVLLEHYEDILRECERLYRDDEDAVDEKGVVPQAVIAVVGLDGSWLGCRCERYRTAITLRRRGAALAMIVDPDAPLLEEPTNIKGRAYEWCEHVLGLARQDSRMDYRWQTYHEHWNIIYPLRQYPDVPDARLSAAEAGHA